MVTIKKASSQLCAMMPFCIGSELPRFGLNYLLSPNILNKWMKRLMKSK